MNKNIKMFVICAVFVLISSCKNYTISKDLKNLEQNAKEKVEGFLETKKEELTEGIKSLGSKVSAKVQEKLMQADEPQGQLQQQISQGVAENPEFKEIEKKQKN